MIHLRAIAKKRGNDRSGFPFDIPIIRSLDRIEFPSAVTLLVGENGSGKSTFLEGLAAAIGSVAVGSAEVDADDTLAHVRGLAGTLSQTWNHRTRKGFFLRAEDFFGYAKRVSRLRAEAEAEIARVDREYDGRSDFAKGLAKMPHASTIGDIDRRYGAGLDAQSHGESFLKLFQSRLQPDGLYLLDEPEAPLSPLRQLAFLSLVKEMESKDCQFIIATHSPILLAYPGATILSCDRAPIVPVQYDELDHVTLTRDFLNDPVRYLSKL